MVEIAPAPEEDNSAEEHPKPAEEHPKPAEEPPAPLKYDEGMPAVDVDSGEEVGEGVKKMLLQPGNEDSGKPVVGATVFAHYKTWVRATGSKVFDTWDEKQQLEMTIGSERRDLKGLSMAIRSMHRGERALFLVPHALAYGDKGNFSFPSVPPEADLIYEVQLNGFDNPAEGRRTANLTVEDKIESADKRRLAGNDHFKENRLEEALLEYEMALGYMGEEFMMQMFGKYRDMANAVRLPCLLNSAACQLKLGKFQEAAGLCSMVLTEEKSNVKALYRRGRARMGLGHMDEALEDLKQAQKLAPGDSAVTKAIAEIKKDERERREKEKQLFKGVLDKSKGENEKSKLMKDRQSSNQPSGARVPWWRAVWTWLKNCVWHFFDWLGRRKLD